MLRVLYHTTGNLGTTEKLIKEPCIVELTAGGGLHLKTHSGCLIFAASGKSWLTVEQVPDAVE